MRIDAIKIQSKINRMEELYVQIIDGIADNRSFDKTVIDEYTSIKKDLLLSLFKTPIHFTEDKHFPDVRKSLQKLTLNGDPFYEFKQTGEKNLDEFHKAFKQLLAIDLTSEIDQLASDEFYSWFSGEEYIESKISAQILILQCERLPKFLAEFVNEIRECFVFQNYIAAFVLCRTVFEIAIRDIVEKRRVFKENSNDWHYVQDYVDQNLDGRNRNLEKYIPTLEVCIDVITLIPPFEVFKQEMHDLRIEGNRVVHAMKTVSRAECEKMIKSTFWTIHKLYEKL